MSGRRRGEKAYDPGLASHPDHRVAAGQMSGFRGMVCVDIKGGQAAASRVFDPFVRP